MAKKKFGISPSVNNALTQTAQLADTESSKLRSTEMLLHRVHLDPDNPRNHHITIDDINHGISKSDPNKSVKQDEYDGLCELADSIKKDGLLHPIVVMEDGNDFKVVAGERRFLASLIAKRTSIEARVFKERPSELDLKIVQWIENQSRRDLSLSNKLKNLQSITKAFDAHNSKPMTAIKLSEVISASRQTAQFYMSILNNSALMRLIEQGKVTTFKKASKLCSLKSEDELNAALLENHSTKKTAKPIDKRNGAGRKRSKVSLGSTNNANVAKLITDSVLANTAFSKHRSTFNSVDWSCMDQSTKAFKKLLSLLENEFKEKV